MADAGFAASERLLGVQMQMLSDHMVSVSSLAARPGLKELTAIAMELGKSHQSA